jgi:hypothetical protein
MLNDFRTMSMIVVSVACLGVLSGCDDGDDGGVTGPPVTSGLLTSIAFGTTDDSVRDLAGFARIGVDSVGSALVASFAVAADLTNGGELTVRWTPGDTGPSEKFDVVIDDVAVGTSNTHPYSTPPSYYTETFALPARQGSTHTIELRWTGTDQPPTGESVGIDYLRFSVGGGAGFQVGSPDNSIEDMLHLSGAGIDTTGTGFGPMIRVFGAVASSPDIQVRWTPGDTGPAESFRVDVDGVFAASSTTRASAATWVFSTEQFALPAMNATEHEIRLVWTGLDTPPTGEAIAFDTIRISLDE